MPDLEPRAPGQVGWNRLAERAAPSLAEAWERGLPAVLAQVAAYEPSEGPAPTSGAST